MGKSNNKWFYGFESNNQDNIQKLAQKLEQKGLITDGKITEFENHYLLDVYENKIYTPRLLINRMYELDSIAGENGVIISGGPSYEETFITYPIEKK